MLKNNIYYLLFIVGIQFSVLIQRVSRTKERERIIVSLKTNELIIIKKISYFTFLDDVIVKKTVFIDFFKDIK